MKELRLNKEEKELVALAERNGFEEWSYKSWRRNGEGVKESLTKSMTNRGEWSLVKEYPNGTRIKMIAKELEDMSYHVCFNFIIRNNDTDNTRRKGTNIRERKS